MARTAKNRSKKNDRFGKIYREFTRVKFRKYKLQFPRLRESEIVTKIIRQWEAMDEEAKENLEKQFIERSGHGFLEEESSSSKKRREEAERVAAEKQSSGKPGKGKKKKPSPKVRVFQEKSPKQGGDRKDDSDFKRSQEGAKSGKKSTPDKSSDSHLPEKTKQITKISQPSPSIFKKRAQRGESGEVSASTRKQEYLTFFKYYYQKLGAEHPRWNKNQISTIIKLLWKKRLRTSRRDRLGTKKRLTGRQLYRRVKEGEGFMRDQIKQMWKALPHQSKRYWQIRGLGKPHLSKKNSGRFVRKILNSGGVRQEEEGLQQKDYSWMENPMK